MTLPFESLVGSIPHKDMIDALAKFWGIQNVQDLSLLHISENASFLVTLVGKRRFVLRIARPDYHGTGWDANVTAIRSEAWLADHLRANLPAGSPVDVVQVVPPIQVITPVPIGDGDFLASLYAFCDGDKVRRDQVSTQDFFDLGQISAMASKITRRANLEATRFHFFRPTWTEQTFLSPVNSWGDWRDHPNMTSSAQMALEGDEDQVRRMLSATRLKLGWSRLIHGDMRAANLLRQADGRLLLLDFDDCNFTWPLFDLAASLSFDEALPTVSDRARAWIEGYRLHGSMPKPLVKLLPELILLRRLSLIGWMGTHPHAPEAQELGAEYVQETVGLLFILRDRLKGVV